MGKKRALIRRWLNIILGRSATAVKQGVGKYYSATEIKGYYNDLTLKSGSGTELDENDIPITEISGGEKVHFPIAIFQYGLAQNDLYLKITQEEKYLEPHKEMYLDRLKKIADFAVKSQRKDGSWDAFGPMKSSKYTVSSMCQGEGASLLFRAGKLFGNEMYTDAAFRAIDFMLKPYSEGGTAVYSDENLYLEEYPQEPKRSVLNGWIFSIFGLYDAAIMDERYTEYLDMTVDTLAREVKKYDNGYWSMYDMQGKIASPAYHDLHIALLKVLGKLTLRPEFSEECGRFSVYQKSKVNKLRAVLVKLKQKLTENIDVVTVR